MVNCKRREVCFAGIGFPVSGNKMLYAVDNYDLFLWWL